MKPHASKGTLRFGLSILATAVLVCGCDDNRSNKQPAEIQSKAPLLDPNGNPWPAGAAYIQNLPRLNNEGLSEITVDNRSNNSAVFVKMVEKNSGTHHAVRSFHIPQGGQFTLANVSPGIYEIRYMDLSSGQASKSEAFTIQERQTPTGIEYSTFTLTLYTVANGNMRMKPLSASEF